MAQWKDNKRVASGMHTKTLALPLLLSFFLCQMGPMVPSNQDHTVCNMPERAWHKTHIQPEGNY